MTGKQEEPPPHLRPTPLLMGGLEVVWVLHYFRSPALKVIFSIFLFKIIDLHLLR